MRNITTPRWKGSRGSVTAELAVVLPALTVLLAVLLLSVSVGLLQLRLEEGARAGARAAARGDSMAQVIESVSRIAGEGASISVTNSAEFVTVTVQGRVEGVLSRLLPWNQSAAASTKAETAVGAAAVPADAGDQVQSHGQSYV